MWNTDAAWEESGGTRKVVCVDYCDSPYAMFLNVSKDGSDFKAVLFDSPTTPLRNSNIYLLKYMNSNHNWHKCIICAVN